MSRMTNDPATNTDKTGEKYMAKVTGIGGVFIKSTGKGSELAAWYEKNLGLDRESWGGSILKWTEDTAEDGGLTVWSTADSDSKWFSSERFFFYDQLPR